ncbi:hypothetical protein J7K70_01670 [bacterium]|nr:hypothetical protein [bacterium]
MEKGEKDEEIRFVQPVPFGTMMRAANIKIDDKGNIWIGKRIKQCLKNIHSAIQQQLDILYSCKGILLELNNHLNFVSQVGKIKNITNILDTISGTQEVIEDMQKTKNTILKQKLNDFSMSAKELNVALQKEKNRISLIEKGILNRLNHLKQEQKRCERVIIYNVEYWFYIYKILTETPKEKWRIKWSNFRYGLRSIRTLKENPYRERIYTPEIKRIELIYPLVKKGSLKKARIILWKAILKLLPLYPEEMRWVVGGNTFVIREGKIKEVIYGSTIH